MIMTKLIATTTRVVMKKTRVLTMMMIMNTPFTKNLTVVSVFSDLNFRDLCMAQERDAFVECTRPKVKI